MSERSASDPFATWRELLDKQTEAWTKLLSEMMGTEAFAAALGRQMETYLSTHGQFQKRFMELMEQYLKSLNLPSRADLARLAAQVAAVEAKVDEQDARSDDIFDLLQEIKGAVQALDARLATLADAHQTLEHEVRDLLRRRAAPLAATAGARPEGRRRRSEDTAPGEG